jgi:hypothetical protein
VSSLAGLENGMTQLNYKKNSTEILQSNFSEKTTVEVEIKNASTKYTVDVGKAIRLENKEKPK